MTDLDSVENAIMCRQLAVKSWSSNSWLIHTRKLLARYDLPAIHTLIELCPSKSCWRSQTITAVHRLWEKKIDTQISLYPSLKMLHQDTYRINHPHIILDSVSPSVLDVRRIATKLRLVTGTYGLQSNRPAFNQHNSTLCLLCCKEPETREHFLCHCPALQAVRLHCLQELHDTLSSYNLDTIYLTTETLLQFLLNCRPLIMDKVTSPVERSAIESQTRRYCFILHNERFTKLNNLRTARGLSRRPKMALDE